MKKFFLLTALTLCSYGVFAATSNEVKSNKFAAKETTALRAMVAQVKITATYVSSCGATWSLVAYGSSEAQAANGIYNLMQACDAACGSNQNLIVIPA